MPLHLAKVDEKSFTSLIYQFNWIQLLYSNNRNTLRCLLLGLSGWVLNRYDKTLGMNSLKRDLSIGNWYHFQPLLFSSDSTFNWLSLPPAGGGAEEGGGEVWSGERGGGDHRGGDGLRGGWRRQAQTGFCQVRSPFTLPPNIPVFRIRIRIDFGFPGSGSVFGMRILIQEQRNWPKLSWFPVFRLLHLRQYGTVCFITHYLRLVKYIFHVKKNPTFCESKVWPGCGSAWVCIGLVPWILFGSGPTLKPVHIRNSVIFRPMLLTNPY